MAARFPGGPRSQEGYPASPVSSQQQHQADPFGSSNALPTRGYYDGESENQDYRGTRDTYASDSSQGPHDGERYYDNNGYDPYSQWSTAYFFTDKRR